MVHWYHNILFYTFERLTITTTIAFQLVDSVCYHTYYTFCTNGLNEMNIARNNIYILLDYTL